VVVVEVAVSVAQVVLVAQVATAAAAVHPLLA